MIIPASNSLAIITCAVGLVTSPAVMRWIDAATTKDDHKEPVVSSDTPLSAPAQWVSNAAPSKDTPSTETNRAVRDWAISRLGGDANDDEDDAMVPVRWEPGVGFVKRS